MIYTADLLARARANIARFPWAAAHRDRVVASAGRWAGMADDELWGHVFGPTIKRSWMVWSDGYCPSCHAGVPMYEWVADPFAHPWKMQCPRCQALFPTNDFESFYRSGLDAHGVFDSARADRRRLHHASHPDPADPLHRFGVDDGDGFEADGHRWRFIGAYLVYGQWRKLIVEGVRCLSAAYALTGDARYARKAVILLDRIADLYPDFDWKAQGIMYDQPAVHPGYVSYWCEACPETSTLATAYSLVREAIDADTVAFLAAQAKRYALGVSKETPDEIRRRIEDRILRDALAHPEKIYCNFPRQDVALITLRRILDGPAGRDRAIEDIARVVADATAVDGVTGEKGLSGYTFFTINALAQFLESCARVDPAFLPDLFARVPALRRTWRFHIDAWCLNRRYYPTAGDAGCFARSDPHYLGARFRKVDPDEGGDSLAPVSMFSFFWRLYEQTGDADYLRVMRHENGGTLDGMPHDLFAEDPESFRGRVAVALAAAGGEPPQTSINFEGWHLAILRSGRDAQARAAWLDCDTGMTGSPRKFVDNHCHSDGLNLGLFACGLDLMPDFGYPPVNYGGWGAPRARWYRKTAAHNTVVVDGKDQSGAAAKTSLWADGSVLHAVRASGAAMIGGSRYERTVLLVDTSPAHAYLVDIFRVAGGADHAKFMHSHFGSIRTPGLNLAPAPDYGCDTQMRGFRTDPSPVPGWTAEWVIEDRYGHLPAGSDVRLRYTDLTTGAAASLCEGWVCLAMYANEEAWIPRVMVRRTGAAPLESTFVAVIEPFAGSSRIASIRRLPLLGSDGQPLPDSFVAVEVQLTDGRHDVIVASDVESGAQTEAVAAGAACHLRFGGDLALIRRHPHGSVEAALCAPTALAVDGRTIALPGHARFVEGALDDLTAR